MQDMSTLRHNLDLAAQQKAGIALSLKEDRSRERETGYDFAFVRDASAVFERIEDARLRPLDVLRDVGEALEPQMALEEMDISKGKTVVTLSFPKTLSPAEAYEASLHFRDAVRKISGGAGRYSPPCCGDGISRKIFGIYRRSVLCVRRGKTDGRNFHCVWRGGGRMRQKLSKASADILGRKRIRLLASLLAGVVFLGGYHFVVLQPKTLAMHEELTGVRQDVISMETEIRELRAGYLTFSRQKARFDQMKAQGFFNGQNRLEAQKAFDRLKEKSGLSALDFEIGPLEAPEGGGKEYRLLKSRLKISVEAKGDEPLHRFLSFLRKRFPALSA